MNVVRKRILELVEKREGELSWYQLDRALSTEGLQSEECVMDSIKWLLTNDYIRVGEGYSPAQPVYYLGRKLKAGP